MNKSNLEKQITLTEKQLAYMLLEGRSNGWAKGYEVGVRVNSRFVEIGKAIDMKPNLENWEEELHNNFGGLKRRGYEQTYADIKAFIKQLVEEARALTEEEQRIKNSGRKLYQQGFKDGFKANDKPLEIKRDKPLKLDEKGEDENRKSSL